MSGDEGRAYVYHGSASGSSLAPDWTRVGSFMSQFGSSVGTAGDVNGDGYADVIVGAPRDTNGQNIEGRAFVYHGSTSGLSSTLNWTAESNQANARLGTSVDTAGDVNGDGYADVIVGHPCRPGRGGAAPDLCASGHRGALTPAGWLHPPRGGTVDLPGSRLLARGRPALDRGRGRRARHVPLPPDPGGG
jgi:hypothetical protein